MVTDNFYCLLLYTTQTESYLYIFPELESVLCLTSTLRVLGHMKVMAVIKFSV